MLVIWRVLHHRVVNYIVVKCLIKCSVDKTLYFWYPRFSPSLSTLKAVLHQLKSSITIYKLLFDSFSFYFPSKMRRGLDTLLFNLLVLGFLCDKMGRVWRRRMTDLYVIEITTASPLPTGFSREEEAESLEVGKLVLRYKYSIEKFNKPVIYTSEFFFWQRLQLRF